MSVGGWIIEIASVPLESGRTVTQLWCVNGSDEIAVLVEPATDMPSLGEEIWWQGGVVMFDRDRKRLKKIGYSFDPRDITPAGAEERGDG